MPSRFRANFLLLAGLAPLLVGFPVYRLAIQLHKEVLFARFLGWLEGVALVLLVAAALGAALVSVRSPGTALARLGRTALFAGVLANVGLVGLGVYFNDPRWAPAALAAGVAIGALGLAAAFWRKPAEDQALSLRTLAGLGGAGLALLALALPYVALQAWADVPRNPASLTPPPSPTLKAHAPKRIVLVTFDELRWTSTSLAEPSRDTTPVLASLAAESTEFSNLHSAGDQTLVSMPTVLSGMRPPDVFARVHNQSGYIRQGAVTGVAAFLKSAGYRTVYSTLLVQPRSFGMRDEYDDGWSVASFIENPFNGRDFVPLRETLEQLLPNRLKPGPYRTSTFPHDAHPIYSVVEQGAAMYREPAEREFLWVHLGLPHHPYYRIPREDVHKLIKPMQYRRVHPFLNGHLDEPVYYESAYEDYLRFSDAMFGRLLGELKASPLWADTLLVVTSDHGTRLDPVVKIPYGVGDASEVITHVPLVIHAPGQRTPRKIAAAVRHEDLVPTMLDPVFETLPAGFKGTPLLRPNLPADRIGYSWAMAPNLPVGTPPQGTVVAYQGALRLSLSAPGGEERLTDWQADPAGKQNLLVQRPHVAEALRAWIDRELKRR